MSGQPENLVYRDMELFKLAVNMTAEDNDLNDKWEEDVCKTYIRLSDTYEKCRKAQRESNRMKGKTSSGPVS